MTLEASPYKQITTEYYQNFKKWLSESGNISACPDAIGYLYGMNRFILKRIGPYNLLQIIDSHRFDLLFQTRHHWEYLKRYHNAEIRNLVTKLCFDYCKQSFEEYLDYEASRVFATQTNPNTLYIHRGNIACLRFHHKTNDITVSLPSNSNQRIKATATHCWKCNIIFMPKRQYLMLRKAHRFLVADVCEIGDDGYTPVTSAKMKAESTLRLCGYSVDKDSPLSDLDRKDLLANIISNGILSRAEILQHLNHLILYNGSKDSNFSACCRWEEDYTYVSNLSIEDKSIVTIDEIQPYANKNKQSE